MFFVSLFSLFSLTDACETCIRLFDVVPQYTDALSFNCSFFFQYCFFFKFLIFSSAMSCLLLFPISVFSKVPSPASPTKAISFLVFYPMLGIMFPSMASRTGTTFFSVWKSGRVPFNPSNGFSPLLGVLLSLISVLLDTQRGSPPISKIFSLLGFCAKDTPCKIIHTL